MGKAVILENYRVELVPEPVAPTRGWQRGLGESTCRTLAARARQMFPELREVRVAWDEHAICEICGYDWSEGRNGEPSCCEAARLEWREERGG